MPTRISIKKKKGWNANKTCQSKIMPNGYPFGLRGEDLDTPLRSHKTLGPHLRLYKEFSPIKTWSLQEASANSRQDANNWAESALQEGCPTLMANLKGVTNHPATFFPHFFCRRFCALRRLGPFEPGAFCRERRFQCTSPFCLKHLDMAVQSSKLSSLQKTDWYFTWLRQLLQNDLSTKSYAFNMMILTTGLSTHAREPTPFSGMKKLVFSALYGTQAPSKCRENWNRDPNGMPETMLGDMPNIMQSPPTKKNTHTHTKHARQNAGRNVRRYAGVRRMPEKRQNIATCDI